MAPRGSVPDPASRRRVVVAFAIIALLGLGAGAAANQAVVRLLALPEGEAPPVYADGEPPAEGVVADAGEPAPDAEIDAEGGPAPRGKARAPRVGSKKSYAEVILRRNIFDSTAVYDPDAAAAGGGDGSCTSDGNMKLLATIVADPPEYSSALISLGASKEAKIDGFALGDEVGSSGRITLIEQKKVCMDGGSCVCIGEEAKAVAATSTAAADAGVSKEGDNKFVVEQSVIDEAMNNFESLAGQIRVVPHKDSSGAVDGYRLSAIRRGSLFDKLGIKNGDIVHAVNGQALTSTEGALSTYQTLKSEKNFTFDVTRRNQRMSMEYEVR